MGGGSVKRFRRKATKVFKKVAAPFVGATELAIKGAQKIAEAIIPVPDIPSGGGDVAIDSIIPGGAPIEEATLSEFTDEELEAKKRRAKKLGSASLKIPLGGSTNSTTVGK